MKIITISVKCSDTFNASYNDKDYRGYVPKWLPSPEEKHYGDYVHLDIDIETGKIVNWKQPSQEDLDETFKSEEE